MQRIRAWILNHRYWSFKCFADTWLTFWENLRARSRYRNSAFLLHCAPLYRLLLPSSYLSVEPGNIMQVHCSILLKNRGFLSFHIKKSNLILIIEQETNVPSIHQYQNTCSLSVQMLVISGSICGTNKYGYGVFGIFLRFVHLPKSLK